MSRLNVDMLDKLLSDRIVVLHSCIKLVEFVFFTDVFISFNSLVSVC